MDKKCFSISLRLQLFNLFCLFHYSEANTMGCDKNIVIIGGGAAGIAAATKLLSNGFKNIVILEAGNRFGGRVNTVQYGNNVVDLGAQWCHGEKGNVVYEMAKDKNLLSSHVVDGMVMNHFRSDGNEIPREVAQKLNSMAFAMLGGLVEEKAAYDGSIGNFFADKYWQQLQKDDFEDVDKDFQRQAFEIYHATQKMKEGCDSWYELSSRKFQERWICEGEFLLNWKDKGFITVFDLLQNKISSRNDSQHATDILPYVQLNKEVQKIVYKDALSTSEPIQIYVNDGSVYKADHLICTVSLGVLKHNHLNLFEPFLPTWKRDSIDGISFGTVDKVYVEYDAPFWHDQWEGASLIWLPEQLKEIHEDSINGDWLNGLIGFFRVSHQPNILCGWITGPKARLMEQKSYEDVKCGVDKVLKMFFSKRFSVPDLKSIKRSKWHSNPHFRGSYSSYSVKSDALGVTTSQLAEPINDQSGNPVIQFAGEATSEHYFSSVHGAIETGRREAQRLIDLYI